MADERRFAPDGTERYIDRAGRVRRVKRPQSNPRTTASQQATDDHSRFQEAGKKGGAETKAKFGTEGYQEMGKKGGAETRRRHGPDHYARMGKKGGAAGKGKPKWHKAWGPKPTA